MSTKAERRAASAAVGAYHEAQLAQLVERVAAAIERFRAGELNAFEVDDTIFQYKKAAKELWKFCNLGNSESAASSIADGRAPDDWWEQGAPSRR